MLCVDQCGVLLLFTAAGAGFDEADVRAQIEHRMKKNRFDWGESAQSPIHALIAADALLGSSACY